MAISFTDITDFLNKHASQMDAGSQAMLAAAQAARPSGAPPLPKMIEQEQQQDPAQDVEAIMKDKDSELESTKEELNKLKQQLASERLAHQQETMFRDVEKKEREALQRIRQEEQSLNQKKTMSHAEEIKHKADLEKQLAQAQVKMEQNKSKALIDLNKEQTNQIMASNEKARKEAERYKDDARKQIDQERQAFQQSKGEVSPALAYSLNNAISSLKSFPMPGQTKIALAKEIKLVDDTPKKEAEPNPNVKEVTFHKQDGTPVNVTFKVPMPGKSPITKKAAQDPNKTDTQGTIAPPASQTSASTSQTYKPGTITSYADKLDKGISMVGPQNAQRILGLLPQSLTSSFTQLTSPSYHLPRSIGDSDQLKVDVGDSVDSRLVAEQINGRADQAWNSLSPQHREALQYLSKGNNVLGYYDMQRGGNSILDPADETFLKENWNHLSPINRERYGVLLSPASRQAVGYLTNSQQDQASSNSWSNNVQTANNPPVQDPNSSEALYKGNNTSYNLGAGINPYASLFGGEMALVNAITQGLTGYKLMRGYVPTNNDQQDQVVNAADMAHEVDNYYKDMRFNQTSQPLTLGAQSLNHQFNQQRLQY